MNTRFRDIKLAPSRTFVRVQIGRFFWTEAIKIGGEWVTKNGKPLVGKIAPTGWQPLRALPYHPIRGASAHIFRRDV